VTPLRSICEVTAFSWRARVWIAYQRGSSTTAPRAGTASVGSQGCWIVLNAPPSQSHGCNFIFRKCRRRVWPKTPGRTFCDSLNKAPGIWNAHVFNAIPNDQSLAESTLPRGFLVGSTPRGPHEVSPGNGADYWRHLASAPLRTGELTKRARRVMCNREIDSKRWRDIECNAGYTLSSPPKQ